MLRLTPVKVGEPRSGRLDPSRTSNRVALEQATAKYQNWILDKYADILAPSSGKNASQFTLKDAWMKINRALSKKRVVATFEAAPEAHRRDVKRVVSIPKMALSIAETAAPGVSRGLSNGEHWTLFYFEDHASTCTMMDTSILKTKSPTASSASTCRPGMSTSCDCSSNQGERECHSARVYQYQCPLHGQATYTTAWEHFWFSGF